MNSTRSISSEIGTALAVLAIYLLTLLAPLHEARASQLAFEKLGYSTLQSGWVLCSSLSTSDSDPDSETSVSKCPVTGVGKSALVAPALDAVVLDLGAIMLAAPLPVARVTLRPSAIAPPSGPRGPPALV